MAFIEPAMVPFTLVKMEPIDFSGEDSEAVGGGNEADEDMAVPDPTSMLSVGLEEEQPSDFKISIAPPPAPPPAAMPKALRSSLWYHYNRKEEDRGECKYCKTTISVAGGSMGNLKRHLVKKHPKVPLDRKGFSSLSSRSTEISPAMSTASCQQSTPATSVTISASTTGRASISKVDPGSLNNFTCMTPANATFEPVSIGTGQSSLINSVDSIKPLPIYKSKEIDIQLLKMICKDYHPFSIVEDKEFRMFVSMLCPSYNLPGRKTLSTSLLPQVSHQLRENIQEKLNATTAVALTADGWTSLNNQSFLAVTAHYLDHDTKLHSSVLGCLEFSPQHTAENIADFLKKEMISWSIQDKIVAVITDNSANIVAAVKICKWAHIPCYAHTINLIVNSSIKPIASVIDKVKSIVQFFRTSSFALNKLKETQGQMNMPILKLKQEVPMQWYSLFDMLVRVLENKLPIISTLAVLGNDEHKLSMEEWEILENLIKLFQIFCEVTKEVSIEQTVSLPKIEVLTQSLINFISAFQSQERLPAVLVVVADRMKKAIEEQLLNISNIVSQATLLDPRFKKNGFKAGSMKYTQAYNEIVNEVDQLLAQEAANQLDSAAFLSSGFPSLRTSSFSTTTNFNLWEDFDSEVAKTTKGYNSKALATIEMDKYISEMLLPRVGDPLFWWEQRKLVYPHLYSLVLKRLCIPASSVPSERLFSKAGQILTEKRSRLSPSKVSEIVFVNGNL